MSPSSSPAPARPVRAGVPASPNGRRGWSLRHKLPLLMAGLLIVILACGLAVTRATLHHSALTLAVARLAQATSVLDQRLEVVVGALEQRTADAATDPTVQRALAVATTPADDEEAAADLLASSEAVASLLGPSDSTTVELWNAAGRRVAFVGADARARGTAALPLGDGADVPALVAGIDSLSPTATQVGGLYGVSGRVFFWMVAPIRGDGTTRGYLARQYELRPQLGLQELLRGLIGPDVVAYFRNVDGSAWTTISGLGVAAPTARDSASGRLLVTRPQVGTLLTAEDTVAGTPFVLTVEMPLSTALAPARATMRRLSVLSLLLMLLGVAAAWIFSRRLTQPLDALADAAEAIARGDYDARVGIDGQEGELTRLGASFNRMAEEVGASRRALVVQTREAQAAALELDHSNSELREARESAERARSDAETAREQAVAANRAKSEFLAVMSHELRTPLNAIAGYTELLELGLRGPITDAQRRDLERIRASQQHLLGLISGVLDLSRIETGRVSYDLVRVPVDGFLAALDALVAPQAAAKSLTLEYLPCDRRLGVQADREKLRQVLLNLLSNAIRYTPPGGRVTLAAEPMAGDRVRITVRDTGIGIPQEALERIFEPFVQLDRTITQSREGVGLGLAISRDLAHGMDGELTVESRRGTGSCFAITLPRVTITEAELAVPATGEYAAVPDLAR